MADTIVDGALPDILDVSDNLVELTRAGSTAAFEALEGGDMTGECWHLLRV